MKVLKKVIHQHSSTLAALGLIGLISTTIGMSHYQQNIQKLGLMQEGMGTCFQRLFQSYTARIIGDQTSPYLESSFLKDSENCLGEVVGLWEEAFNDKHVDAREALNTVSSDSHWFHEKLKIQENNGLAESTPESVILSNINTRFEKLEMRKDEFSNQLDSVKEEMTATVSNVRNFFFAFVLLSPLLILIDYLRRKQETKDPDSWEKEAGIELKKEDATQRKRVEELVYTILTENHLYNTATLFKTRMIETTSNVQDTTGTPEYAQGKSATELNGQIERMWEAESKERKAKKKKEKINLDPVKFEETLSSVMDLLSSKIFTNGIKLQIETEEVEVFAKQESLQQILYHVMVNSINSYDYGDPDKNLHIKMRQLGGVLLVDFYDSARSFDSEFLKFQAGLVADIDDAEDTMELVISNELAKEFGGKLSFENVANDEGVIVGRKVQLSLNTVPVGKIKHVEKTTKRNFIKKLQGKRA
jgi:signal transduction histidine kinase